MVQEQGMSLPHLTGVLLSWLTFSPSTRFAQQLLMLLSCIHWEIPRCEPSLIILFNKMQHPQLLSFCTNVTHFHCKTKENPSDLGQAYLGSLCFYELASFQHWCTYLHFTLQHQKHTILPTSQMGS